MAVEEIPVAGRRWVAPLLILVAGALVPWTIALGWELPASHTSHHWDAAWVGLDIAEALALGTTGYGIIRGRAWLVVPAAMSAALLLTDAWFDNLLANTRQEHVEAALQAGLVEVPLALISIWLALNVERAVTAMATARSALERRRG